VLNVVHKCVCFISAVRDLKQEYSRDIATCQW